MNIDEKSAQAEIVSIHDAPFAQRKQGFENEIGELSKKWGIVLYADYTAEETLDRKTGESSIRIKPLLAIKDTVTPKKD